jgi:hypothetical protein
VTQPPDEAPTGRLFRAAAVAPDLAPDAIAALPDRRPERDSAFAAVAAYAFGEVPAGATAGPDHTPAELIAPHRPASGLTLLGAWLVVVGATVIMGFADAVVRLGSLGWLTGVGLLAATVYAAAASRRDIMWWTVIIPPLAMAAAAITAGQLTLGGSGSLLVREGFMVFGTLTSTAWWTLGSIIAAAVIVLIRRRRAA